MAGKIFAAIDIGSFELELGIYEISPGSGIRKVDHVRYALALGSDTYQTGIISYQRVEEMCREVKLIREGKLEGRPAEELLYEL